MELRSLANQFLSTLESPNTRRGYETDLKKFREWWRGTYETPLTIEGITRVHAREWRNWMKPRYAVSTTNRRLTALSSFLAWCVHEGHIQTNPVSQVKWLKQQTLDIKWLTPADEGRVIRFAEREYSIAQNGGTAAGNAGQPGTGLSLTC